MAGGKPLLSQPLSWEEDTVSQQHIWHEVDTREACHLAETQFCQVRQCLVAMPYEALHNVNLIYTLYNTATCRRVMHIGMENIMCTLTMCWT